PTRSGKETRGKRREIKATMSAAKGKDLDRVRTEILWICDRSNSLHLPKPTKLFTRPIAEQQTLALW
ncbi:hypothetical protein, partial [Streptococcus salivarius]|uniref:hypothetical protein n=1 Tax=Streptococcus salivarius TaxID=1304 RepID=UPI001C3F30BD